MSDKLIENKVNELLKIEDNDSEKLCKDLDLYVRNDLSNKEIDKLLDEIIDEMRTYYMKNESKMYQFNESLNPSVTDKLVEVVKETLVIYDAFSVIRNMELQDADRLLDEIFESCVLRRDLDYMSKKIESDKEMDSLKLSQFIGAFRSLVYDCVSRFLNETSIKKLLEVNTDINPLLVNSVTQNINSNFFELKINYLISSLRNRTDK